MKKSELLIEAFHALSDKRKQLIEALSDIDERSYQLENGLEKWVTPNDLVDSLTRLCRYADKDFLDPVKVGYIQLNDNALDLIGEFNQKKINFKAAVAEYKGRCSKTNKVLDGNRRQLNKLLKSALAHEKQGKSSLSGTPLAELDLKACYKQIRVINNIEYINFMLEKQHLRVEKIDRETLVQMVDFVESEYGIVGPSIEMNKVSDNAFAIAKTTNNRFMANVHVTNGNINTTSTLPVSGLIAGNTPAKIQFSDGNKKRKPRGGKRVDINNPFIPILSVYRYTNVD